jgi:hypothetical protein
VERGKGILKERDQEQKPDMSEKDISGITEVNV